MINDIDKIVKYVREFFEIKNNFFLFKLLYSLFIKLRLSRNYVGY